MPTLNAPGVVIEEDDDGFAKPLPRKVSVAGMILYCCSVVC